MNITYISNLCSLETLKKIKEEHSIIPMQSIQKYHRLICEGMVENNINVKTISSLPIIKLTKIIKFKNIKNKNLEYRYIPTTNIRILRYFFLFFYTVIFMLKDIYNNKNSVFICDILNTSLTIAALIICKLFRKKCIALVTDRPQDVLKKNNIILKLQNKFDGYIFLTEYMNKDINKYNKPYIIIEGIVDKDNSSQQKKYKEKVCMYAGGLYEKYGIKVLIEAFKEINIKDAELHIYGFGELEQYIKNLKIKNIKFFGNISNQKIVEEEKKATLLINPRYSNEEYTKYSFPSKNIEYMSSGTPLLTTKLKGIPEEYNDYLYFIEKENKISIKEKLEEILSKDYEELNKKGLEAKKFVMNNKNKVKQAQKIIKLIEKL